MSGSLLYTRLGRGHWSGKRAATQHLYALLGSQAVFPSHQAETTYGCRVFYWAAGGGGQATRLGACLVMNHDAQRRVRFARLSIQTKKGL